MNDAMNMLLEGRLKINASGATVREIKELMRFFPDTFKFELPEDDNYTYKQGTFIAASKRYDHFLVSMTLSQFLDLVAPAAEIEEKTFENMFS